MDAVTPTGKSVAELSESSRAYTFAPDEGVHGRLRASMGPEWCAGLNNAKTCVHVVLALCSGIKTYLGVTVTGEIETVMCFYDTEHRPYDIQCVGIVMRLAWAVGDGSGGKRTGEADS